MDAEAAPHLALAVAAFVQAACVRLAVADPNGGAPIVGVVLAEISETHVSFRADDGLIWPIAKASLALVVPVEVAP